MMLPTHALVGMALGLPVALSVPEFAPAALLAGLVGGVFPDLDLYSGHRRTLHFPTLYPIAVVPAAVSAFAAPSPATVGLAVGLAAAAAHCRMDVYGSGLELRPWEGNSERAVYDHVDGEWVEPRRLVAYDGSVGDLAISTAVALPLFFLVEGAFVAVVVAAIAVAATYTLLRRHLAELAPIVFGKVPDRLASYVPERYRTESTAGR
ncbi:metal-dependent hydrolase [Natronomonas sp. F2-12]|jgi:hypothetical protein|uniref:Metal-dependent hydrolase n=1 Tax=Natronomonas aquatica TaxID=2841590 RepID=A0A9R1CTZ6_9EURY|nr:metal-dependent hydrolase [Natronomonas aquatica]MCQ4333768.1 metal-dependent hydrolase [Natronomonas aquatica]